MLRVHPADLGALMMHAVQQLRNQHVRENLLAAEQSASAEPQTACAPVRDDGKMPMSMF